MRPFKPFRMTWLDRLLFVLAAQWDGGGWHWQARRWPAPYVNIPYWPHRVLVVGLGRLSRRGNFHRWQPCCYRMRLQFCCDIQKARTKAAAGLG